MFIVNVHSMQHLRHERAHVVLVTATQCQAGLDTKTFAQLSSRISSREAGLNTKLSHNFPACIGQGTLRKLTKQRRNDSS